MKILSIDTATENCSVAIYHQDQCFQDLEQHPKRHAKMILPMVESLLKRCEIEMQSLDCLAFGRGPGSFTGLRIASSVIQAFGLALKKPIVAISNLQALAQAAYRLYGVEQVCAVIDARMQEVYVGQYVLSNNKQMHLQGQESCLALKDLNQADRFLEYYGVGSGITQLQNNILKPLDPPIVYSQAQDIAVLAVEQFKQGNTCQPEAALPVYLRNNVAKI